MKTIKSVLLVLVLAGAMGSSTASAAGADGVILIVGLVTIWTNRLCGGQTGEAEPLPTGIFIQMKQS
jgi:hypothetical protein